MCCCLSLWARVCLSTHTHTHTQKSQRRISDCIILVNIISRRQSKMFPPNGHSRQQELVVSYPIRLDPTVPDCFSPGPEMFCCLFYRNHLHLPRQKNEKERNNKKHKNGRLVIRNLSYGLYRRSTGTQCYVLPGGGNTCGFTLMAC